MESPQVDQQPLTGAPGGKRKKERTDGTKYTFCYAMKQQLMKAWKPVPTLGCGIIIFFLLGGLFAALGGYLWILNGDLFEWGARYDKTCGTNASCFLNFKIKTKVTKNIAVYYELRNFYQSHRKFLNSKSPKQLRGNQLKESETSVCKPAVKNKDIGRTMNWKGTKALDPEAVAFPCGAMARSFFNDSFVLEKLDSSGKSAGEISISAKNVAWSQDPGKRFKNLPENKKDDQWMDVEDERFNVWMRAALTSRFRKLWGRVLVDLPAGNYKIVIANRWPVAEFKGEKHIYLAQMGMFGGRNILLSYMCIGFGIIMILTSIAFGIRKLSRSKGILQSKIK